MQTLHHENSKEKKLNKSTTESDNFIKLEIDNIKTLNKNLASELNEFKKEEKIIYQKMYDLYELYYKTEKDVIDIFQQQDAINDKEEESQPKDIKNSEKEKENKNEEDSDWEEG